MENSSKLQENQNPSLVPFPNSRSTNSSTSSSNSNGLHHLSPPPQAATTPRTITRSEPNNPYPTTFVQANSSSFKQVVQMLTGSSDTAKQAASAAVNGRPEPARSSIPPIKAGPMKQPSSRLCERRNSLKNLRINPLVRGLGQGSGFSPRHAAPPEVLSPSVLDFPSLVLSPVTPLIPDPFFRSPNGSPACMSLDLEAEDEAIAKKRFFLHQSPANTPRDSEPRLLPLFPVTSPRVSGSSP